MRRWRAHHWVVSTANTICFSVTRRWWCLEAMLCGSLRHAVNGHTLLLRTLRKLQGRFAGTGRTEWILLGVVSMRRWNLVGNSGQWALLDSELSCLLGTEQCRSRALTGHRAMPLPRLRQSTGEAGALLCRVGMKSSTSTKRTVLIEVQIQNMFPNINEHTVCRMVIACERLLCQNDLPNHNNYATFVLSLHSWRWHKNWSAPKMNLTKC